MIPNRGARTIRAIAEATISISRLHEPEKPETDLCGVKYEIARVEFPLCPAGDEFPDLRLEEFTRKSLHPITDVLHRPSHRFKSFDRANESIDVLLREQHSVDSIPNC